MRVRFSQFLLVVAMIALVTLAMPLPALAGYWYNWTYCYDRWDVNSYSWFRSQSTNKAARWWPQDGYAFSSCYYRLGNSLDTTWRNACGAAANTWTSQDCSFCFYSLPLGSDSTDHTLGISDLGAGGPIARVFGGSVWNSQQWRAEITNWYMRFTTRATWCSGALPDQYDRQACATHEFGHCLRLLDLDGDWPIWQRPTMQGSCYSNDIAQGTL